MRVAALYDIHGNLPALDAVLEEVERVGVDLIVIGGDAAWGPFPSEVIDVLWGLDAAAFVRGNADREVGGRLTVEDGLDPPVAEVNVWCADRLTDAQRTWLTDLPTEVVVDVDELGATFFCHGSPRSDDEPLTRLTPEERLREAIREVAQPVVVCGHTHMQFDRSAGDKRIVNAGSVGLPYQRPPGAFWALLGPRVELRRTEYDRDAATRTMRRTDCPRVEDFFVEPLLDPPAARAMAEWFEQPT